MPRAKGQKSGYTMSEKAYEQRRNAPRNKLSEAIKKTQHIEDSESEDEELVYMDNEPEDKKTSDAKGEQGAERPEEQQNQQSFNLQDIQDQLKQLFEDFQSRQKVKEEREKSKPERVKKADERKKRIEEKTRILQALKEDYEERVARKQTVNRLIDNKKASLQQFCKF